MDFAWMSFSLLLTQDFCVFVALIQYKNIFAKSVQ